MLATAPSLVSLISCRSQGNFVENRFNFVADDYLHDGETPDTLQTCPGFAPHEIKFRSDDEDKPIDKWTRQSSKDTVETAQLLVTGVTAEPPSSTFEPSRCLHH